MKRSQSGNNLDDLDRDQLSALENFAADLEDNDQASAFDDDSATLDLDPGAEIDLLGTKYLAHYGIESLQTAK